MLEVLEQTAGGLYGERSLSHPARTGQGHHPVGGNEIAHTPHGRRSADQLANDRG
jgi:hypothetical protein